jgi:hypothetical protein
VVQHLTIGVRKKKAGQKGMKGRMEEEEIGIVNIGRRNYKK